MTTHPSSISPAPLPDAQPVQAAFRELYRGAILHRVRQLKDDGTVAMGEANLFALTVPRGALYNHAGAPRGTNAAYYLRKLFREIIARTPTLKRFIIGEG